MRSDTFINILTNMLPVYKHSTINKHKANRSKSDLNKTPQLKKHEPGFKEVQMQRMANKERRRAHRAEYEAKKRTLLESCAKFGINLNLCGVLLHFVIGNYLHVEDNRDTELTEFSKRRNPAFIETESFKITLLDIVKRWNVLKRVEEILKFCKGANPEAVFQFCMDDPLGGPQEFQELKANMQKTFQIMGNKIFAKVEQLLNEENEGKFVPLRLDGTPLEKEFDAYKKGDKFCTVRRQLLKWFDKKTTEIIMTHPIYSEYILLHGDDKRTAKRLRSFWNTRFKRYEELVSVLLPIYPECERDPIPICFDYIFGVEQDIRKVEDVIYDEFETVDIFEDFEDMHVFPLHL